MTTGNGQSSLPAFTLKNVGNLDARQPMPVQPQQPVPQYTHDVEDNSREPSRIVPAQDSNATTRDMVEPVSNGVEQATMTYSPSYSNELFTPDYSMYRNQDAYYEPAELPQTAEQAYPALPPAQDPGLTRPTVEQRPSNQRMPSPPQNGAMVPLHSGSGMDPAGMEPSLPPPDVIPGMPGAPDMSNGYVPAGEPEQPSNGQMVPYMETSLVTDDAQRRRKMMIYAGVGVGVAAGLGGLIWYFSTRKKKGTT